MRQNVKISFTMKKECIFCTRQLHILVSVIWDVVIKPDPERLQPLRYMSLPNDLKSRKRVVGLFACYFKWIKNSSKKIRSLTHNTDDDH